VTYVCATSVPRWKDETSLHHVNSPRVVAGIAAVVAAFIAYAFMVVFDHVADTLLYAYAWNKKAAHNTVSTYAPPALQKITGYTKMSKPVAAKKESPKEEQGWFSSLFSSRAAPAEGEQDPLLKK